MSYGLQFISISWTDGIRDNEAIMIVRDIHIALRQALIHLPSPNSIVTLPEVRPFGYWVLQDADPSATYSSTQWYIDRTYDRQMGHLLARKYLDVVLNEPYQYYTPHYDLAIMHYPLFDEKLGREVFGVDVPGRAAIFSNAWLNQLPRDHDRPAVLRRLIAHYLGRIIGIPYPVRPGTPGCSGLCAMRPADQLESWVSLAREEFDADRIYCDSCRSQFSARIASNQLGTN